MKKLSEQETMVLRALLDGMPHGATGNDLVYSMRTAPGINSGFRAASAAGMHRTAASLCRKGLAYRAGTPKLQWYKITQPGRDVLQDRNRQWAMFRTPREAQRVRYVSPFGSPAVMERWRAEKHLAEDEKHWTALRQAEAQGAGEQITPAQRQIGPPYIRELPR